MDEDTIRPGVWLAGVALLGAIVTVVVLLLQPSWQDELADSRDPESIRRSAHHSRETRQQGPPEAREEIRGLQPQAYGPSTARTHRDDPQLRVMYRTIGSPDAGVAPFSPTTYRGRITSVRGDLAVREGADCDVRVLPVRTRRFNCVVRVMCDDVVLYPDGRQRAGFAPCDVEDGVPTRALDDGTTRQDGDPAIDIDLVARRVHVRDELEGQRFEAEVRLEDARL
ncbi:MAG: hypothetical protein AAGE52_28545 [Myxococcota bacterium]